MCEFKLFMGLKLRELDYNKFYNLTFNQLIFFKLKKIKVITLFKQKL